MIPDLFHNRDQPVDLRARIVVFDGRFSCSEIDARGLDSGDCRELLLDTPDTALASHTFHGELESGLRHTLMMHPRLFRMPYSDCQCAIGQRNAILFAPVIRFPYFLLFVAFAVSPPVVHAQAASGGAPDPVFSRIPFEQWLSQGDHPHMRWTVRLSEPGLSTHQRLITGVNVEVDGAELARRRGKGQFLVLVQVKDEKGRLWQNHQEMDLEHIEEGIKANDAVFSQLFFVLPGDYGLAIAIFANATGEHSVIKRRLHVPPLKNDPLPGAWSDLPPVEFVPPSMPPDNWYLPSIRGKLRLAVETHEPVHIDLVVNLTPSEELTGSTRAQNRTLGLLLPSTKLLSQVDWGSAEFSLALLDLSRRHVTYRQDNREELDWSRAADSLSELNPGIIDVKSLEKRQYGAEFFLDEIRRRIGATRESGPRRAHIVIVLSSAVRFESGQEVHPIALDSPPESKVFYIRYLPAPRIVPGRSGGRHERGDLRADYGPQLDQLEPLLKPLEPRLFDVSSPEQFRKALAAILSAIEKL